MRTQVSSARRIAPMLALAFCFGCSTSGFAGDVQVKLGGREEVPSVATSASGTGTITIGDDKSVSGSISTQGIEGIAAHIHRGARGENGPPVVTLVKSGNAWTVPEGTKLTDEQYASFKAGALYVNIHSAAHKSGEIRGQLAP